MESQEGKKNSGVTIANIVSLVGLVLLLVFSFLGHTYKSCGEYGWDLLIPICITAAIGFLLWFLIKAKGAENDLKKWKILEGIAGALYLCMFFVSVTQSGITHFFNAYTDRENIKKYAKNDLGKIDTLFVEYEEFEEEAISRTRDGLKSAVYYRNYDDALKNFMNDGGIEATDISIASYIDIQREDLLGTRYDEFKRWFGREKEEIEAVVDAWNTLLIGMQARRVNGLKDEVETTLTSYSSEASLPVILRYNDNFYYCLGERQEREFEVSGDLQFKEKLQGLSGFNAIALIVVIIVHLLILFNYFVAYRTRTLGVRTELEDDGGIIL